ncbi:MAG: WG repeat-containing protein [Candidatus Berkelbacteria bacterium]|nr:WG repeat-containing protein [Candidatus Berkelbacteria bacterium]
MMSSRCEQLSEKIRDFADRRGNHILRACEEEKPGLIWQDFAAIVQEVRELKYFATDKFETVFRSDLAAKCNFDFINPFSEGLAWAYQQPGHYVYLIDRSGSIIARTTDLGGEFTPFRNGHSIYTVKLQNNGGYRYFVYNTDGESSTTGHVRNIYTAGFAETGLMVAEKDNGAIYINELGKNAFPEYLALSLFHDGVAWAESLDYKETYLIDTSGHKIKTWDWIDKRSIYEQFSGGYSWIRRGKIKSELYDKNGECKFEAPGSMFKNVNDFHSDRAIVDQYSIDMNYGSFFWFIDPSGEKVSGAFEEAGDYNGRAAWVRAVKKRDQKAQSSCYLIDLDGKKISQDFEVITNFVFGSFFAKTAQGEWWLIDDRGNRIGQDSYKMILSLKDAFRGFASVVDSKGKNILINHFGREIFSKG